MALRSVPQIATAWTSMRTLPGVSCGGGTSWTATLPGPGANFTSARTGRRLPTRLPLHQTCTYTSIAQERARRAHSVRRRCDAGQPRASADSIGGNDMPDGYILGLDAGTSVVKAAIFDLQ